MMLHCRIVTPHGVYKEFDTPILNIPGSDGRMGLLPNHMPLVTMLKIGQMSTEESGVRQEYAIAGGLLYFDNNLAKILTDAIENKADIDEERAEKAKERALSHLGSQDPDMDMRRAQIALEKAINRIRVKKG